ncbi:receptor-like protein 19 [Dioscorea cayenensis subsp. rotundata]|uniref:Receptor-like protein 19 n=1 Tax=Dioscorea cayennensis subsp. rotundata TaxID=55577 RepID=A0AB40AYF5_DIOCR|nr:receptor-like protein 19 [Dioscorea cayenensis subsp. rotundata]
MACLLRVVLFDILVVLAFPAACYVHGIISCIETERIALLSIKAGMWSSSSSNNNNNNETFLSSWTGHDCCHWRGVSCNHATGHVTKLDLQYPYDDPIPPPSKLNSSLVQLHHLKHLDLSMNNFEICPIPDFIGSLANLKYLNLSNARFSGIIPHTLGKLSRLRYLDLTTYYFTNLKANNLHWLSGMTSLHYLDLSGVDLSNVHGWLHDINMLSSLLVLKLSRAQLRADAGGINDTALLHHHLNFTSLRVLDLSANYDLNITLLQWLFNLNSLVHLDLSFCALHGKLPVAIGNLSSLKVLSLVDNSFDGVIPESLGNLGSLERLDLSQNDLNGSIPESLCNLTNLVYFDLSSNQVQGRIPTSIGNLRNLQYFDLSRNMISGAFPESFGNLTLLQYFDGTRGNNLSGKLPETVGNLVHLQFLDLSQNAISGKLPDSLGNLRQLQQFRMPGNGITGKLPESAGKLSSLWELDLSKNNINGTLPKGMGNLCKLQTLDFTSNSISGGIDDLIDGLSKCRENKYGSASESSEGLTTLRLGNNKLNGTVPEKIGQLSKLSVLHLSSNSLMGVLTESHFANLTNLAYLDFSYNSLQLNVSENWKPPFNCKTIRMCSCKVGPIFPTWVKTQTQLGDLCLSDAGISGNIPAWFWDLSSTTQYLLNLSNNNLEGRLPTSLKNYIFSLIDMSSNKFEGPLPELNPTALFVVDLTNNTFSGSIPSYFAAATHIQVFSLSDNHVNGSIPSFFCKLTTLTLFDVSNNDMSGALPNCWNVASALEIIDLSDNNFTGKIPGGLMSFTNLQSLHLRNNGFSGDLPLSLKMANKLVTLDIGENKLSGSIPTWFGESLSSLIVLRMRSNLFEGVIPEQLSKLSSLQILDLAHNNLSGCIPHSFGDFKAMAVTNHYKWWSLLSIFSEVFSPYSIYGSAPDSFAYSESLLISAKGLQMEYSKVLSLVTSMDLSNNKLSCELPEELTKLHGLHFLNLSHNHFNGKIPQSINDMEQLESLDLSENNLFGTIPSGMSTLNFLGYLNLSHNNLSGKIPSGGQLQTFDPSAYNWNHDLCGSPLQNCANETHYSQGANEKEGKEDWSEMLWLYIGLAMGFITGFWMIIGTIIMKKSIRIAYFRTIDKVYDYLYVKMVLYSRRFKSTFSRRN